MSHQPARARDLGLAPGPLRPGRQNAIVDVPGVRVGHTTIVDGDDVRTGVTAVVPDAVDRAGGRLPARRAGARHRPTRSRRDRAAAVRDAVEEAVLNSLLMAVTTVGYQGRIKHAVAHRDVLRRCRAAAAL